MRLNGLRALHGVHDRREVHQKRVTDGFDDRAAMFDDGLLDNVVMDFQQPQHAGFVAAHLVTDAHHVGEHNGCQLAGLSQPSFASILAHGRDYAAAYFLLSNGIKGCEILLLSDEPVSGSCGTSQLGECQDASLHTFADRPGDAEFCGLRTA